MRMRGFRRKDRTGTLGMRESVIEAAKKGVSASGKNTLKVEVLEPVERYSKRARRLGISGWHQWT